jgi:hypothetical protein
VFPQRVDPTPGTNHFSTVINSRAVCKCSFSGLGRNKD